MTDEENEILIRLDERTCNIWTTVEKIERHIDIQNGHLLNLNTSVAKNTSWRKTSKWIIGGVFTLSFGMIGWVLYLIGEI